MDKIYKALAEINRRKIVFWLSRGELNVGQIVEKLDLTQATVSNHLAILKKAGLISCRVLGKERIYKLNRDMADSYVKEINRLMLIGETKLEDEIILRR